MRVYVFAMLRGRWFTQCLDADDLKTSVSGFRYFDSFETLLKALSYVGVPDDELAAFAKRTNEIGKGSVNSHWSREKGICLGYTSSSENVRDGQKDA